MKKWIYNKFCNSPVYSRRERIWSALDDIVTVAIWRRIKRWLRRRLNAEATMWKTTEQELPELNQRVIVAAWEQDCTPFYFIAHFWQSSGPGQPPKFYLDETYRQPKPVEIGQVVHFWMPFPDLPQPEKPRCKHCGWEMNSAVCPRCGYVQR